MKSLATNIVLPASKFVPGTSEADLFTLDTPQGRARLFKRRVAELTAPKHPDGKCLSLDEALFEMRTGGNADDAALLEAMGEKTSSHRTEKLHQEQFNQNLTRLAHENARAMETSPEVKAATARNVAFNARIDELTGRGLSIDQAILQMRANSKDAALLQAMRA